MAEQRAESPAPAPKSTGRRYTELEKWEACERARETTIAKAAKELDLSYATLQRWLDRYPAGSRRPVAAA